MKIILTQRKLKYFKFETMSNKIINGVLILNIYQSNPTLQIRSNLLPGGLVSQVYHGGIHCPTSASTTRHIRGVDTIKKHKMCLAEGCDIRPPVKVHQLSSNIQYDKDLIVDSILSMDEDGDMEGNGNKDGDRDNASITNDGADHNGDSC